MQTNDTLTVGNAEGRRNPLAQKSSIRLLLTAYLPRPETIAIARARLFGNFQRAVIHQHNKTSPRVPSKSFVSRRTEGTLLARQEANTETALVVHAEQARLLCESAKPSIVVNFVNGLILVAAVLASPVPALVTIGWYLMLILALLLRARLLRKPPTGAEDRLVVNWLQQYANASFIVGFVWGCAGLALFFDLDTSHIVLVSFILAGMSAGAAATNSAFARAAILFFAPALFWPCIYFASRQTMVDTAMALLVVVFFAAMMKAARTIQASVVNSVVTSKRAAELAERLSAISDYTYAWESWLSDTGDLLWVNPSVKRVTGYTPEECATMPEYPMPIIHPDDHAKVVAKMHQSKSSRRTSTFQCRIVRKDGITRWCEVVHHPARNSTSEPFGFRASIRDITEQVELTRKLETLATTDPLTGLFNRRYFFDASQREIRRSRRFGRPLSFALLDIDHFKKINDRYGHGVGDECLKAISCYLADNIRATDTIGRHGGEEFIILMPETDVHQAQYFCERVCQEIGQMGIETKAGKIHLSVSIGVTAFNPPDELEVVIERVDGALYRAKNGGRNRVAADDNVDLVVI